MKKKLIEFSKVLICAILLTYFIAVAVGVRVVWDNPTQLGVFVGFVGAATTAAIGFYENKAKGENIIKIQKSYEQEGEPENDDPDDPQERGRR